MLQELLASLDAIGAADLRDEILFAVTEGVLTSREEKINGKSETVTRERPLSPDEQYIAAARLVHERLMVPSIASIVQKTMEREMIYLADDKLMSSTEGQSILFPPPQVQADPARWMEVNHSKLDNGQQLDNISRMIDELTVSTNKANL